MNTMRSFNMNLAAHGLERWSLTIIGLKPSGPKASISGRGSCILNWGIFSKSHMLVL